MKNSARGALLGLVLSSFAYVACGDETKPQDPVDPSPDASTEPDAAIPATDAGRDAAAPADAEPDAAQEDAAAEDAAVADAGSDAQVEPMTYSIGGQVQGLAGTLVLQNGGGDDLTLIADGDFVFAGRLVEGQAYHVTIAQQPADRTCSVTRGQGSVQGAPIDDVAVVCVPSTTTLVTSVSELALSVTGLIEFGSPGVPLSGLARVVTITNTGVITALGVDVILPLFPVGTMANTTCAQALPPGASCTVIVNPGATASSDGAAPCTFGTAPIPATVSVRGTNTNVADVQVAVLGYGCVHGGGYVFSFDDTTPNTASVGVKVWSTVDQAAGPTAIRWSSTSTDAVANDAIFGIGVSSLPFAPLPSAGQVVGQLACSGAVDGACNTNNLSVYYEQVPTGAPIDPASYAAGQCKRVIDGHSDWYLPAVCELGYGGGLCGTSAAPVTQNVSSSLVDQSVIGVPQGAHYWSSTQSAAVPQSRAMSYGYAGSGHMELSKSSLHAVRCARAF